MKVHLTNPTKELDIQGPMRVKQLLEELQLTPEAYLVIRGDELVTEDEKLNDGDTVEIRSVISGG
jgi:sulfur carrier protein